MVDKPLTQKQENFCLFYVELDNASEAYRRAYSPSPDCLPQTIWEEACKLKSHPKVSTRIGELRSFIVERAEITVDRIASELAKVGFANMEDYMSVVGGEPKIDWSMIDREKSAAISSIEYDVKRVDSGDGDVIVEQGKVKFKLHDKLSALDKLGKHAGMFQNKLEVTGKDGGPLEIADASDNQKARAIAAILAKGLVSESD